MTELDKLQLRVERAKRLIRDCLSDIRSCRRQLDVKDATPYVNTGPDGLEEMLSGFLAALGDDDTRPTCPTTPTTPNEDPK